MMDYSLLKEQMDALTGTQSRPIPNLANASALIWQMLGDINWAGFYLMERDTLDLGPFQGKPACIRIPLGQGVCGNAAQKDQILRVYDVHEFEGHIACDSASRSEIVLPVHSDGSVIAVLDIDSPLTGRFSQEDEDGLREIVKVLEGNCIWK